MIHAFILNPFPELLSFSLVAPLLIRIVVGPLFVNLAMRMFHTGGMWLILLGVVELLGGVLLFLGAYTQIAALTLALISLGMIIAHHNVPDRIPVWSDYYLLLFTMCISLMLTGAGIFAFDLPL